MIFRSKANALSKVRNLLEYSYKGSTIEQRKITVVSMFFYAQENQIIPISPVVKLVKMLKTPENKGEVRIL